MPTERQIVDAYTRRALLLLRVGHGLSAAAARDLRALAKELRAMLGGVDLQAMGRRDLAALLRAIDATIVARYDAIAAAQMAELDALQGAEAAWAARAGALPSTGAAQAF